MLLLIPAFDVDVVDTDGRTTGFTCIPWQESGDEWALIVGCNEQRMGQFEMSFDKGLNRFAFHGTAVPPVFKAAESRINERVHELVPRW